MVDKHVHILLRWEKNYCGSNMFENAMYTGTILYLVVVLKYNPLLEECWQKKPIEFHAFSFFLHLLKFKKLNLKIIFDGSIY